MNLDDLIEWIEQMRKEASAKYVKYKHPGKYLPGVIGAGHDIIKHIKENRAELEKGMRKPLRFIIALEGGLYVAEFADAEGYGTGIDYPLKCNDINVLKSYLENFAEQLVLTAEFVEEKTDGKES